MKQFTLSLIFLVTTSLFSFADNWIQVNTSNGEVDEAQLVSSTITNSTISFTLDGFWYEEIQTSRGVAWKLKTRNGSPILKSGSPDLPLYATSLIIPNNAQMEIKVVSSKYTEYMDVLIAPSKGNLLRTTDPKTVDYEYGKQYGVDTYYPSELGSLREPYVVRDYRGQTLLIQPIHYNPITKTLRVYYDIVLEVNEVGTSVINILNDEPKPTNRIFENIYNRHFLNFNSSSRYTPVEETGNMLIISHVDFMDEMQPFIDWKIMSGTPVEIVDVASIGNSAAIKQYIEDYYNNNGLTFVILVGDAQQVPTTITGGNDSDVAYSYVAGNDHYPDLFVGRFSAEAEAHVVTQVQRVLDYEKYPISDTSWYSKSIGIASNQGPGDDGEMDYQHLRNIADLNLLPFTYNYAYEFFDGSQGGNDASGNPSPSIVADAINSGATIINYTGHGSASSWGTSGFSNNNISNLTNSGKLPFIFSVACVNGDFVGGTCFAEVWLRSEHNSQPSGAIAALMSTINQSWNPPMRGQDEMNDILTETYSDNIKRTFGGISMNGCMNMNDVYGSGGYEMTDTWTCFGDPSVEIRTAAPEDLTVTHPLSIFLGSTSLIVNCDTDGALATLSMDGNIIGSAIASGGVATIEFDALTDIGTADIVVTSFNHIPYISTVDIVPAEGPFVVYANNVINDILGNNDGLMDYAENIQLTIGLTNIGVEDALDVNATLTTTSAYVEITTSEVSYGDIIASDTISIIDGFAFNVSNDIPDEIIVNFTVTAVDQDGIIWESGLMLTGHSPKLVFSGFVIDDSNGNNNGKPDPGETFDIIVDVANEGSSDAYNGLANLTSSNQYVSINSDPQAMGDIMGGETNQATFSVTADGDTPEGTSAFFELMIIADNDISGEGEFFTIIGKKPVLILNLSNSISEDSMAACFTELQTGYDVATSWTDEINTYTSVFILLGMYPNNHILTEDEGEMLKQYLDDGGRVYMEGGDTWYFDSPTVVHPMFHINGIADGSGDLSVILGEDESMMSGYMFEYSGNNSYVDILEPKDGGTLIFSNSSPEYGTGISYENVTYKTIGTSFEFGGMVDGTGSTKDGVMAEILYFFGVNYTWTDISTRNEIDNFVVTYPNPVNDILYLRINLKDNTEASIKLLDIQGKIILESTHNEYSNGNQTISLDMKNVKPGVYFINCLIGGKSETKKIIKMR